MEKIKVKREQEIRTLKQREFDAEVKRCVMFLLGDENHKDYDYYFTDKKGEQKLHKSEAYQKYKRRKNHEKQGGSNNE
jgi:hypothetical protein